MRPSDAGLHAGPAPDTPIASYRYDHRHLRVTKTVAGQSTVFHHDEQGQLIAETRATGEPLRSYVWLEGAPGHYLGPIREGWMAPEPRGSGDYFAGDSARLDHYLQSQRAGGARDVRLTRIRLTPGQERALRKAAEEQGGQPPGLCAAGISALLSGVCGLEPTMWPGRLREQAEERCP